MGKKRDRTEEPSPPSVLGATAAAPEKVEAIRRRLLEAYDEDQRDLPWRRATDPYRILVSEVMLQQTRVETVIPYYKKWMKRFPRLDLLAEAGEEDVLGIWQGLGYYSRARYLLGAARVVRERYGGELPRGFEELRELPGVGEYTAGAVASIAFGAVVPAVDGNARRVLARLFDLPDPRVGELRSLARALVDPSRPGDFNQALMELGATVCVPRIPACSTCPLSTLCLAREHGTVQERPVRKKRGPVPEVVVAVVVVVAIGMRTGDEPEAGRGGRKPRPLRLLLRKRPGEGLLAGMWEFPGEEVRDEAAPLEVATRLLRALGPKPAGPPLALPPISHAYSHLKATYRPFLYQVLAEDSPEGGGRWVTLAEVAKRPLPVAHRKILKASLAGLQNSPAGGTFPLRGEPT